MAVQSPFEPDPDLDPIQLPPGAEAIPATPRQTSRRPVIVPAEPRLWQVTVPLEFPLIVDGERLDVITVHRPTGADVAELMIEDDQEATLNVRLRARMCRIHPDVLEKGLAADDGEKVAAACRPFLPRALLAMEEFDAGAAGLDADEAEPV